jgi:glutamine synthetase
MELEYMKELPLSGVRQVTYVWIGGKKELRSKSKTILKGGKLTLSDLPEWDYDGSSTDQATGDNSEVLLKPQALFRDPFRIGGYLVMCDTYTPEGKPHPTNERVNAKRLFEMGKEYDPWFGIEQEFYFMKKGTKIPAGFPQTGIAAPQGQYYCSVGASNCYHRNLMEVFYRATLYAGLKISGINAEVGISQWEFQVGPCLGIEEGDHLWMARYILERISEKYDLDVCWDPKPVKGDWNGSGCHTNYSTKEMREEGGLDKIIKAVEKLGVNHKNMINVYGGEDNKDRLTGKHETASWEEFSWGYANRGATVRVGRQTEKEGKGYMEVRAVASNCDPYLVTSKIFETTHLS